MTALWNRAGHYIFVLWFLLSIFFFLSFFLFSLAYSQPSQIGCLLYILHMVWPKCELKCRSETCCTRLAGNAGPKITKNSPSAHHCIILSGYSFAIKARIDNRKKHVKQQCLLHMSSQYGELQPASGWDRFVSLGHPSKFQRLSRLGISVTARHSGSGRQPNFAALNRGRHL